MAKIISLLRSISKVSLSCISRLIMRRFMQKSEVIKDFQEGAAERPPLLLSCRLSGLCAFHFSSQILGHWDDILFRKGFNISFLSFNECSVYRNPFPGFSRLIPSYPVLSIISTRRNGSMYLCWGTLYTNKQYCYIPENTWHIYVHG